MHVSWKPCAHHVVLVEATSVKLTGRDLDPAVRNWESAFPRATSSD